MRLKEIKPGMVIRCKDDNEKVMLWNWFNENGYVRENEPEEGLRSFLNCKSPYGIYENSWNTFYDREGAIDFSDLILPELSAEEVWSGLGDISDEDLSNYFGADSTDNLTREEIICSAIWDDLVDLVTLWKVDHSKKEPDVEWVFDCFQNSNIEQAIVPTVVNTEDEAKKWCEDMAKKYQLEAFAYIPVCMVKGE